MDLSGVNYYVGGQYSEFVIYSASFSTCFNIKFFFTFFFLPVASGTFLELLFLVAALLLCYLFPASQREFRCGRNSSFLGLLLLLYI